MSNENEVEFKFSASDVEKHSAAHVTAAAVKSLYPEAKIGIGPVTKDGFFYDFETNQKISSDDFQRIEEKINEIIQSDIKFERLEMPKLQAVNTLLHRGEIYKMEMTQNLNDENVSFYKLGDLFLDLCRGPHVRSTSELTIIKLDRVEETHWNNDESRPVMYRIYGNIFKSETELNEYKKLIEESKLRNYENIAIQKSVLIKYQDELWMTPKGKKLKNNIIDFICSNFDEDIFSNIQISMDNLETYFDYEFKRHPLSYRSLPVLYKNIYESKPETIEEDSITYVSFSSTQDTLSRIGEYFDKIADTMKFFGGENLEVEIVCEDLENKFVTSISNLLQRKIISHNKVLKQGLNAEVMVNFKLVDKIKKRWSICKFGLNSESDYIFVNQSNSYSHLAQMVWTFDIAEIYKFLLEELQLKLPYSISINKIRLIPIHKKLNDAVLETYSNLKDLNLEVELDLTAQSLKHKVYKAERDKVSFILFAGNKEISNNAVSVRFLGEQIGLISLRDIKSYISQNIYRTNLLN